MPTISIESSIHRQVIDAICSQIIEAVVPKVVDLVRESLSQGGNNRRWPEVMGLETAGEYIDRGPEAVRHLIRKRLIPKVLIDSKTQVRRCDLDKAAHDNLI